RYLLYKESELSKAALNKMNPERLLLWSKEE
ncbi:MAG: hypothetical protein ACI81W_004037, partial [Saprospiraceae bacterium]